MLGWVRASRHVFEPGDCCTPMVRFAARCDCPSVDVLKSNGIFNGTFQKQLEKT